MHGTEISFQIYLIGFKGFEATRKLVFPNDTSKKLLPKSTE